MLRRAAPLSRYGNDKSASRIREPRFPTTTPSPRCASRAPPADPQPPLPPACPAPPLPPPPRPPCPLPNPPPEPPYAPMPSMRLARAPPSPPALLAPPLRRRSVAGRAAAMASRRTAPPPPSRAHACASRQTTPGREASSAGSPGHSSASSSFRSRCLDAQVASDCTTKLASRCCAISRIWPRRAEWMRPHHVQGAALKTTSSAREPVGSRASPRTHSTVSCGGGDASPAPRAALSAWPTSGASFPRMRSPGGSVRAPSAGHLSRAEMRAADCGHISGRDSISSDRAGEATVCEKS
eukprot:scaffold6162_cov116-Isochrysis_galbana.AAC.6